MHVSSTKLVEHFDLLIKKGANEFLTDSAGNSILHPYASFGFVDLVKYAIERGHDINRKNFKGITPLHEAAFYGEYDMVKLLVESGANPTAKSEDGHTPYDISFTHTRLKEIESRCEYPEVRSFLKNQTC